MVGPVVSLVLIIAAGDPWIEETRPPVSEGVESNRPIAISPRGAADAEAAAPSRDDLPVIRSGSSQEVVPTVGDRLALASPESIPERMPESARQSSIKLSPSSRKSVAIQRKSKEGGEDASADHLSTGRSLAWWTTTGLGLAVVLAAIFLVGRFAKRLVPGAMVGESSGPVHLLHRTYLSPKHAVCLVKCGDRILMIGLSGDRMQTLSEIHDPQEIDYLRGELMQIRPKSTTQAFRDVLSGRTQMTEAGTPVDEDFMEAPASSSGVRSFVDQISTLRDQISRWKARAST
jgi:flagellar biogenesis protein FliO